MCVCVELAPDSAAWWAVPECVASTVGAAHVPPSSPPGVVPMTISADRRAVAVPTMKSIAVRLASLEWRWSESDRVVAVPTAAVSPGADAPATAVPLVRSNVTLNSSAGDSVTVK